MKSAAPARRDTLDRDRKKRVETAVHGLFLVLGLVTVGAVLLITVYLVAAGIPAIRQIGLGEFLLGRTWASTAADPSFGILPFILTSVYGTAGAILLGVPVGFFAAVYLAKIAPRRVRGLVEPAVGLLAGIPSVVYGLVGMLVLVPGIRVAFGVPDGAGLLAAILVLAVMILPSIIKVSMTALESVPGPLEDPAPFIGITGYLDSSIQYTVRAWVKNVDYWDVYYALLEKVRQSFSQNGVEMTYNHLNVHLVGETKE